MTLGRGSHDQNVSYEKLFLLKLLQKLPKIIQHFYSILFILISWVIFAFEDLNKVGNYIETLFTYEGWIGQEGLYYLRNYGMILFISMVLATPMIAKWFQKQEQKNSITSAIFTSSVYIVIFLLATARLEKDKINPF